MVLKNTSLFIDTSFLIALLLPKDRQHRLAQNFLKEHKQPFQGVLSNLILNELLTFFSRYGDLKLALKFQNKLFEENAFEIIWVDRPLHLEASRLIQKYQDQNISFVDASSFAIMKKNKIKKALSFDQDFIKAGFECWPR